MIGTKLSHYEITSHLGSGGMGEVYQATDTKLGRNVAIKRLPAAFASDPEHLSRFRREAQVLASLNHPNIAHVYGLEESGETRCIVMELVEGENLQARINRGPVPVEESLAISKQIAEALEAAHERGVIHRDLKPGNVMLSGDGKVKVLDFGLAKAYQAGPSNAQMSNSPTTAGMAATNAGIILGTAAYMAPEQARGRAVDKRADIWAFGVVLFEMLSGQRAFSGDDISDTLANVLKIEPNWNALPADVPPRVRQVLRACLQKDPKQRIGDVQSVRLALEGAFETTAPQPAVALPSVAPRRPLPWIAAFAVALLAAAALSIPAVRYLRQTPPPETRLEIVTPATGQPSSFAVSPDGRQVAFVASSDNASRLWLRSLATTTPQPLAGTDGATYPFWSPDSLSIGFFAGGSLKRLDLGSGAPQTLAPATNGSGGTWNADGVIVFAPSITSPLMRVSAAGGAAKAVTTLGPNQFGHFQPQFLPDGRRLLFTVGGATEVSGIYMGGLDGSSPTRLASDLSSGVYAPGGWLLWVRAGALVAQHLDVEQRALTGEPVTLANGVAVDASVRSAVSVAATGLVAYRTAGNAQRQLTWFDRSGTARGVVGEPDDTLIQPRVSPEGRRVAVVRTVEGNQDLWMLDGARASRFTFDPGQDLFPVWSPDSTRIVYTSRRRGIGALYHKLTSGAGVEEQFLGTDQTLTATSWSEDGRFLLYISIDPQTNADIWVMPMREAQARQGAAGEREAQARQGAAGEREAQARQGAAGENAGDRKPFVFLKTPFREAYGTFSPDGRWVAYHSNESGRPEIYVRPFVPPGATGPAPAAAGGGQWQVSTSGGILPLWRSDGKELYYINPAGAMMAAPIAVTRDTLEPGAPVVLFPTRIFGGGADIQQGRQYDVTRDGRFLINTLLNEAAAPITLLQNWNPPKK